MTWPFTRCAATARANRPAVLWLVLLVLPFQGLTAAYLDLRGPAHFHVEVEHDHDHVHSHAHDQGHAEHHHHAADDPTVVIVDDDEPEEDASGWSATMCAVLVAAAAALVLPLPYDGIPTGLDARLRSRFLARLDRPPNRILL